MLRIVHTLGIWLLLASHGFAQKVPTVLCHFSCGQASWTNAQVTTALSELAQPGLSELSNASWVDRQQIDSALGELQLANWNSNSSVALQLGQIVSADLAVAGQFDRDENGPWKLALEIIDLQRADVLATKTIALSADENGNLQVSESNAKQITDAVRDCYPNALKLKSKWEDRVQVAVLPFRNEAIYSRLDFLAADLDQALKQLNESDSAMRMLQFPRAKDAVEEAALLVAGLSVPDRSGQNRRFADYVVWGSYGEVDSSDVAFEDVTVSFKIFVWDGNGEPKELSRECKTTELTKLVHQLVDDVKEEAKEHQTGEFDPAIRQRLAKGLLETSIRLTKTSRTYGSERERRFYDQNLRLISSAALFDPNNAVVRRELFIMTHRKNFHRGENFLLDLQMFLDIKRFGRRFSEDLGSISHPKFDTALREPKYRTRANAMFLAKDLMRATSSFTNRFRGRKDRSVTNKYMPDDIPDSVIKDWHAQFTDEFIRQQQLLLKGALSNRYTPFGEMRLAIRHIDDLSKRASLLELLMPFVPEKHDSHFLQYDQEYQLVTEAFFSVGKPELAVQLLEKIQAGNPDWHLTPRERTAKREKMEAEKSAERKAKRAASGPRKKNALIAPMVEAPVSAVQLSNPRPRKNVKELERWEALPVGQKVPFNARLIHSLFVSNGKLWVGGDVSWEPTKSVLYSFDLENRKYQIHSPSSDEPSAVFGRVFDRGDEFWVSIPGAGMDRLDSLTLEATAERLIPRSGMPLTFIRTVVESNGQLFCGGGAPGKGELGRFSIQAGTWAEILMPETTWHGKPALAKEVYQVAVNDEFLVVYSRDDSRLLVRPRDGSADADGWTNLTRIVDADHHEFMFAKRQFRIGGMDFAGGLLWLGTKKGLIAFDPLTNEVVFKYPTRFEITALTKHGDHLWMGGSGSRLIRFNHVTKEFEKRISIPRKWPGAPHKICVTDDKIWYGLCAKAAVIEVDISKLD